MEERRAPSEERERNEPGARKCDAVNGGPSKESTSANGRSHQASHFAEYCQEKKDFLPFPISRGNEAQKNNCFQAGGKKKGL